MNADPRVLLVEDLRDDETLTLRALRRGGRSLDVRVARDGEEALQALGLAGAPVAWTPDLVISDLKMPRVAGDELLRLARADVRLARVPFVILTSSAEPREQARCLALGASEFAVKPIDYDEYHACVGGLVRRWLPAEASPERAAARQAA